MEQFETTKPAQTAFLSARIPTPLKNRFKSLAARKGQNVQELLNEVISDYVAQEDRQPVTAGEVIKGLRSIKPELKEAGLSHLSLFGSVARGEATLSSDIDLAYQLEKDRSLSMFDLAKIEDLISGALKTPASIDLASRANLHDHVLQTAEDDEIQIF